MTLRRRRRRTLITSSNPPSTRRTWEISPWLLVTWTQRWAQQGTGQINHQWEQWNVLWLPCIKWACHQGTLFPHKKSHNLRVFFKFYFVWRSPDEITENHIDNVAINETWRSSLQDTRVMHSADAGSDHHLFVAVIKMKLLAQKKQRSSRKKYCTCRL